MATTKNGQINDSPSGASTLSKRKVDMAKVQCTSCFLLGHRSNMKACFNYQKKPKRKSVENAIEGVSQTTTTSRKSPKKKKKQRKKVPKSS